MDALSTPAAAAPLSWVESLFKRMEACYGNRFLDMWANADLVAVKGVWAEQMGMLSHEELRRGVAALMTRDWPPTLPEFVKLCRPGIDPQVAYYEALEQGRAREEGRPNVWSSPAIYWAWRAVGAFEFRNQSYPALKVRWEKALADEVGKGHWEPVPATAMQLGVDKKSTAMSARGAAELSKAIANVGKVSGAGSDHRGWARKIVERVRAGDKSIPLIAIKNAGAALGIDGL